MKEKLNFKLEKPLIIFDLETTGVNVVKDRIVQIALLKISPDGHQEEKKTLINPMIPIPKEASEVHGILDEHVKDAPKFRQISKSLFEFMQGSDISGYNSDNFDVPLLIEEFFRCGIDFPSDDETNFIDFFQSERVIYSRKLTEAYKRYTGKELEDAHDAMADVYGTFEVMKGQLSKVGINSLTELKNIYLDGDKKSYDFGNKLYKKDGEVFFNFGKHKDKRVKDFPSYALWMINSDFPRDTKNKLIQILETLNN